MPQMDIKVDDDHVGLMTVGWDEDDKSYLIVNVGNYSQVTLNREEVQKLRTFLDSKFVGDLGEEKT